MNDSDELAPRPSRPRLPYLLVLLATFAAGVFLERAGWLPGYRDQAPSSSRKTFAPFWEAWNKVKEHYVDRTRVDDKLLTEGAIVGMLNSLGDKGHTTYLTKKERDRATEDLSGQLQGIGAVMSLRLKRPTVIQVMPGSPAREVGLKPGDALLAVDDQPTDSLSFNQVISKVRGAAGTEVRLRLQRPGEIEPREVTVKRAKVDVPEVNWHILPGKPVLAHVSLHRFSKNCGKQMKEALEQIRAKGVEGVILDVRGNSGGYKDQCIEVASQFLPEGTVLFLQQDPRGRQEKIPALAGGAALDLPLCLLIDYGTASSSEILAGAVQDNERAKLVGKKTYGTGTVLREYPLSDGSAVRLAVYQWLTPKGTEIWHKGISPDVEVAMQPDSPTLSPDQETPLSEEELKKCGDAQLLKGLEVLRQQIGAPKGEKEGK